MVMKKIVFAALAFFYFCAAAFASDLVLWYQQPVNSAVSAMNR